MGRRKIKCNRLTERFELLPCPSVSQLSKPGVLASLRFLFAKNRANERYRDVSPITSDLHAWLKRKINRKIPITPNPTSQSKPPVRSFDLEKTGVRESFLGKVIRKTGCRFTLGFSNSLLLGKASAHCAPARVSQFLIDENRHSHHFAPFIRQNSGQCIMKERLAWRRSKPDAGGV